VSTATMIDNLEPTTKKVARKKAKAEPRTIAQRLFTAWDDLEFLVKDASNDFAKYKYPKADSVIYAARKALKAQGLMLEAPWVYIEDPECTPVVEVSFKLTCPETGEVKTDDRPISYPVCERNGMPTDKATSASLTTVYAYYVRQLFMLPRVDSSKELDEIDDRGHKNVEWTPTMNDLLKELTEIMREHGFEHDSTAVRQMTMKRAASEGRSVNVDFLNDCISKVSKRKDDN